MKIKYLLYGSITLLSMHAYLQTNSNNHFDIVHWGASARQGKRNYMEDHHTITNFSDKDDSSHQPHFFAVYDGHGGSAVSERLKNSLHKKFYKHWRHKNKSIPEALESALLEVEEELRPENGNLSHHRAGSTAIVTVLDNNKLHIANVGDSRAVIIRGDNTVFSTEDHKPHHAKELARLHKNGYHLDPRMPGHTLRIKGFSLSRVIGDWATKIEHPRSLICNPELYTFAIEPGDILLIASDGLWDIMANKNLEPVVQKILKENNDPLPETSDTERKYDDDNSSISEQSQSIFYEVEKDPRYDVTHGNKSAMRSVSRTLRDLAYKNGSSDNITVLAIQFDKTPKEKTHEEENQSQLNQSINLIIQNAQNLKEVVNQQPKNGLAGVLLNNIKQQVTTLTEQVVEYLSQED